MIKNKVIVKTSEPLFIRTQLDVIQNKNIHFIKDNGLFELGGVTWNHMAVDKTPADYIRAKDFTASYKIALHHGAVNTAKTDIGYQISNEHVGVDLFEGHDITLLGDIHKPAQFLDDARTVAYPGSLIQQNHGEALDHGILVWDLDRRTADFVQIENEDDERSLKYFPNFLLTDYLCI